MLRAGFRVSMGVLCAAALTATPVVRAQSRAPRVAVGPFTGERVAVTRGIVASVLANHAGEVELRPLGAWSAAAARAHVGDGIDEGSVSTVARELGVDEVVVGSLERQNGGYHLRVRVLRGRDGRSAASSSWDFDRIEELNAFQNEIWEQLRGAFVVDATMGGGAVETPTVSRTETVRTGNVTPSVSHEPDGVPAVADPDAATPGLGWLTIYAGGGLAGRRWRIPVLGETTQRGYENNAFGELRASATLLYRLRHNRLGVGIEGAVAVPLGLSSQGRGPDGRVVPIATSAVDLQFGAALAVRPAGGGMFRVFAGLAFHQFDLDTSRLSPEMRLAPVSYVGLRVAGEGTLPIWATPSWEVGAIFGGELRVVATGSEMKEAFGTNPDTTFGVGAWFGLGLRLDGALPGLGMRATADFLRYSTDFAGPARIGTPGESADSYTRYLFELVYAIGTGRSERASQARAPTSSFLDSGSAGAGEEAPARPRASGDPFGGR